jgi:hypothetical protein
MCVDMRRFGNFRPEVPETGGTGSSRRSAGFSPVLELQFQLTIDVNGSQAEVAHT